MILQDVTLTFSDLALQFIVGAVAAALAGRAMRGGGFGIVGDLIFGVLGALGANFVISYFGLFNSKNYGLTGELIVAAIGAVILVVLVRAFTARRSSAEA